MRRVVNTVLPAASGATGGSAFDLAAVHAVAGDRRRRSCYVNRYLRASFFFFFFLGGGGAFRVLF